jgi:hypothetical protein
VRNDAFHTDNQAFRQRYGPCIIPPPFVSALATGQVDTPYADAHIACPSIPPLHQGQAPTGATRPVTRWACGVCSWLRRCGAERVGDVGGWTHSGANVYINAVVLYKVRHE